MTTFAALALAAAHRLTTPFAPFSLPLSFDDGDAGAIVEGYRVQMLRASEPHMILVRRASFRMGSTPDEILATVLQCQAERQGHQCEDALFANETPARNVTLPAFWLDAFEVSVAEYETCVRARRCEPLPYEEGGSRFRHPTFPVSLVNWHEARAYCAFRNARLPSEAEFERAARGTTARQYPWGSLYNSRTSNHGKLDSDPTDAGDGARELSPVGSYASGRTAEGFHDLAGNVAEWTLDHYTERYPSPDATPMGAASPAGSSPDRTIRGGSYRSAAPWLRGAARQFAAPSLRSPAIGFRCARSARSGAESDDGTRGEAALMTTPSP